MKPQVECVCGWHPVEELLAAEPGRVRELWLLHEKKDPRVSQLVDKARALALRIRWARRGELDRLARGAAHQGVAALADAKRIYELKQWLDLHPAGKSAAVKMVLAAVDEIEDPQNLGAIARSALCLGARALVSPQRRQAPVTAAAVRASAGALEKMDVISVGNLAQALRELKNAGFWIYGADRAGLNVKKVSFNFPLALVIGSEHKGLRPLVRAHCDEIVSVAQDSGGVESLNAACAATVLLHEIYSQARDRG